MAETANRTTVDFCTVSLGAIFDYGDSVPTREFHDAGHVTGPTREMDGYHGL